MQKKLPLRIIASLILSVMLFALPLGAFVANNSATIHVFASDDISGNVSGDSTVSGNSTEETEEEEEEETTEPQCICDHKCSKYDYNADCPVCSADYTKCAYKEPSVRITINTPSSWYSAGTSAKITFSATDILNTGNFEIKSVKAKIGQNGSYVDVTEDMYIEISENCTVYVLVTDANDKSYERSRAIKCFDTTKPTLNAAVSDGLLTIQAVDKESGIKVIYVNGYEFTDGITNGTLNVRLSQFDAGYEYFTISAMDNAGNVSEIYKTKNPYYKDPESDDDSNPAEQLPASAAATNPSSATANVTQHTTTDSNGNTTSQTPKSAEQQKKEEFAKADAEEEALAEGESEEMNLGKEFYTIEAASGKVFYLIIDRDGEEEVVYFLTEITENDLLNVTTDNSETLPKNSAALESQIPVTESALPNNNTDIDDTHEVETPAEPTEEVTEEPVEEEPEEAAEEPAETNPLVGYLIMGIFGVGIIGAAYYFKVVKKKQDGDFIEDEDEEDEDEYETEYEEAESEEDDFFQDTDEKEEPVKEEKRVNEERPAPTADDVAETIEDAGEDPYESDSDDE